ncbi:MAG: 4Fe-4S binding protein [Sporomusaceae bacterium]|nr:4Fe-4S binding protein [Sporomusaceae bacterium]
MAVAALKQGPVAVFECLQQIPCNPCADACPRGAITVKEINDCPTVDAEKCNGCGICMTHCPGLSIFVIDSAYRSDKALVKIPYEFYPVPKADSQVEGLNRSGETVGVVDVVHVQNSPNKTTVLWLAMPKELAGEVRAIRVPKEEA